MPHLTYHNEPRRGRNEWAHIDGVFGRKLVHWRFQASLVILSAVRRVIFSQEAELNLCRWLEKKAEDDPSRAAYQVSKLSISSFTESWAEVPADTLRLLARVDRRETFASRRSLGAGQTGSKTGTLVEPWSNSTARTYRFF